MPPTDHGLLHDRFARHASVFGGTLRTLAWDEERDSCAPARARPAAKCPIALGSSTPLSAPTEWCEQAKGVARPQTAMERLLRSG